MFRAMIRVTPREGVLDCQGKAVGAALERLELCPVGRTRVGRWIEVDVMEECRQNASRVVDDMCRQLLAHPVVEDYAYELVELSRDATTQDSTAGTSVPAMNAMTTAATTAPMQPTGGDAP